MGNLCIFIEFGLALDGFPSFLNMLLAHGSMLQFNLLHYLWSKWIRSHELLHIHLGSKNSNCWWLAFLLVRALLRADETLVRLNIPILYGYWILMLLLNQCCEVSNLWIGTILLQMISLFLFCSFILWHPGKVLFQCSKIKIGIVSNSTHWLNWF